MTAFAFDFRIRQKFLPDLRLGLRDGGRVLGTGLGGHDAQLLDVVRAVNLQPHLVEIHDEEEEGVVAADAAEVAPLLESEITN